MIAHRYRRQVLATLAALTLPLTSPQSLAAQSIVPKETWFPTGLDVIRDPLTGRLGVSGSSMATRWCPVRPIPR